VEVGTLFVCERSPFVRHRHTERATFAHDRLHVPPAAGAAQLIPRQALQEIEVRLKCPCATCGLIRRHCGVESHQVVAELSLILAREDLNVLGVEAMHGESQGRSNTLCLGLRDRQPAVLLALHG
jgi:hypothetical protein